MRFSKQYPDFAMIEADIRRARAERAVYLADLIARAIVAVTRGVQRAVEATAASMESDRRQRARIANPFSKGNASAQ
jgi:hypothetical protein